MGGIQQMFRNRGSVVSSADPYFSSVSLLMHFEGTNGQTTTVDSSASARTVNRWGSATLSTAQSKFGTSSAACNATPVGWGFSGDVAFNFGGAPFTLESWVYFTTYTDAFVISQWEGGGSHSYILGIDGGKLALLYSTDGYNNFTVGAPFSPVLNTWHHIAADRDSSNTVRVYLDGAVFASATGVPAFGGGNAILNINGTIDGFSGINGFTDEVRVTHGVARYAGAFTPPTAAFPNY